MRFENEVRRGCRRLCRSEIQMGSVVSMKKRGGTNPGSGKQEKKLKKTHIS